MQIPHLTQNLTPYFQSRFTQIKKKSATHNSRDKADIAL